jgi:hypothetical protein
MAGWLGGNAEISELGRDRDSGFSAIDFVGCPPFKKIWTSIFAVTSFMDDPF